MIRLPDHLQIDDPRFRDLVHPTSQLERLCTGFTWTEGPVWFGDHACLIFSEIPSQTLYRVCESGGLSVFRQPSGFNNGTGRAVWSAAAMASATWCAPNMTAR